MSHWKVRDVMTTDVVSVAEDTGYKEIVDILAERGISAVPVIDIAEHVVGVARWSIRVTAYVAQLTDAYPPFRLDQGGDEPHGGPPGPHDRPASAAGPASAPVTRLPPQTGPAPAPGYGPPPASPGPNRWRNRPSRLRAA